MITKEEKKQILQGIIDDLKKEIIATELNTRYLNRIKLSAKTKDLKTIETNINNYELLKKELNNKLEVAEDENTDK